MVNRNLALFVGGVVSGMALTVGVFVMAYAHGLPLPVHDNEAMVGCMTISFSFGLGALTLGALHRG